MSGHVVFALTVQQVAVLRKLHVRRRDFTGAESIAFYALARRGLVRGSPDEPASPARLTHVGEHAAALAAGLELATVEPPPGTFGPGGAERRQADRRGGRATPIGVAGEPAGRVKMTV